MINIEYAKKLARKIASLLDEPEKLARGLDNVSVAKSQFDYSVLAETMAGLFDQSIPPTAELTEYKSSRV